MGSESRRTQTMPNLQISYLVETKVTVKEEIHRLSEALQWLRAMEKLLGGRNVDMNMQIADRNVSDVLLSLIEKDKKSK